MGNEGVRICRSETELDRVLAVEARTARVDVAPSVHRAACYARRVSELVNCGVPVADILVAVETRADVRAVRDGLSSCGCGAASTCVHTHLEACRLLMAAGVGAPDACRPARRVPRVLTDVERTLVLEDLKYGGVEVGTLRGLMAKMERGCARGLPRAQWDLDDRETCALNRLDERLAACGGMLPCQMWPLALEALGSADGGAPYGHVIADSAQRLGPVAEKAFTNASHVQTVLVGLVPGLPSFVEGVAAAGKLRHIKWRDPREETRGTVGMVAKLLVQDPSLLSRDVLLVVPTAALGRELCGALAGRHLAYQFLPARGAVCGDPRESGRFETFEAYAALALAADLEDAGAWRMWLSLGRRDFGCEMWAQACGLAFERLSGVPTVLKGLAQTARQDEGQSGLSQRARRGCEVARHLAGVHGASLRAALEREFPKAGFPGLLERLDGDDVAHLRDAMLEQALCPCFGDVPGAVHVCTYRSLPAGEARHRHVFALGLVGSLVDKGAAPLDLETLAGLLASAGEGACVSYFQRAGLDEAEGLGLPVGRTRLYQGRRVAVYERSCLVDEFGDVLPGSQSAEQYLGESED